MRLPEAIKFQWTRLELQTFYDAVNELADTYEVGESVRKKIYAVLLVRLSNKLQSKLQTKKNDASTVAIPVELAMTFWEVREKIKPAGLYELSVIKPALDHIHQTTA